MADNITILDGLGNSKVLKAKDNSGVLTPYHNIQIGDVPPQLDDTDKLAVSLYAKGSGAGDTALPARTPADSQALTDALAVEAFLKAWDGGTTRLVACNASGQLVVDSELPAAAALADGASNPTTPVVGAAEHVWNTATWDRRRNNHTVTVLASAARTGTVQSSDLPTYNARALLIIVNVTAAAGTSGIKPHIISRAGGASLTLNDTPALITATGAYGYVIGLGAALPGGASDVKQITAVPVPDQFAVAIIHAGADSYTYSVFALLMGG